MPVPFQKIMTEVCRRKLENYIKQPTIINQLIAAICFVYSDTLQIFFQKLLPLFSGTELSLENNYRSQFKLIGFGIWICIDFSLCEFHIDTTRQSFCLARKMFQNIIIINKTLKVYLQNVVNTSELSILESCIESKFENLLCKNEFAHHKIDNSFTNVHSQHQ